jgi:hypothetical protein
MPVQVPFTRPPPPPPVVVTGFRPARMFVFIFMALSFRWSLGNAGVTAYAAAHLLSGTDVCLDLHATSTFDTVMTPVWRNLHRLWPARMFVLTFMLVSQ